MTGVPFVKMSGAGNDFVVLRAETWEGLTGDREAWVRGVCRRGLSVGADGVLVVGRGDAGRVSVLFRNPDGAEAFCGNGSRCAARFAAARGMVVGSSFELETAAGIVPAVLEGERVTLTLAPPSDRGELRLDGIPGRATGRFVVAGVPHFVVRVDELESASFATAAPVLRRDPAFGAAGANVDFVTFDDGGRLHVRTWERGVEGETLACGTGAVAAAFAARLEGSGDSIEVVPRSGIALRVDLPGPAVRPTLVRLGGDARFVFEGILSREGIAERA